MLNTIFIPDNAFEGFPNLPPTDNRAESPLLNMIILPNGNNEDFWQTINKLSPEYSRFFEIHDQGYSIIKSTLDSLFTGSVLVYILCGLIWGTCILIFCLFYISRKKKEAGFLYALGINKKHRFRWIFLQCAFLIIIAHTAAFGASSLFYQNVLDYTVEMVIDNTSTDSMEFSDGAVSEAAAIHNIIINKNPFAIPLSIGLTTIILLFIAGNISAHISRQGIQSLRGKEI